MTNPLFALFESADVMVAPERKAQFESCLSMAAQFPRINEVLAESTPMAVADDGFWPAADDWRASLRPYVVQDGILMLPVRGVLMHNFPWQLGNWATGYDYIWRAFQRGMDDPSVRAIALIIHSPGGLVAGNQVLVDRMYARRDEKPVRAFAQEAAYSAAYNIFSVADYGVVSSTGGVGSIGVMTSHIDWSKYNERMGMDYTFIFAGKHKVDGNPEEPLPADVKARIQERIDELYEVFVSSVARNRGLDVQAVRGTEALTFTASQAVSNKLADSIGSLDDAIAAFAAFLDDPSEGDEEMTTNTTGSVDQAAHDTAVASARTEGATTGAAAMQTRIKGIMTSEEATDRRALAEHLAYNTTMTVDDAKTTLAASAKETPAAAATTPATSDAAATAFAAAMDGTKNPNVGAGGGDNDQQQADPASADPVLALVRAAGLGGFKPAN